MPQVPRDRRPRELSLLRQGHATRECDVVAVHAREGGVYASSVRIAEASKCPAAPTWRVVVPLSTQLCGRRIPRDNCRRTDGRNRQPGIFRTDRRLERLEVGLWYD